MVQKFCLVCTPRSGSYYLLDNIARYFDLENGKEWCGRVKKVHYEGLRTSPVDIDHSVNEGLLTNKEMSLRLLYLKNYPTPFIIKCMPFQITKTIERDSMPYEESQEIAAKYMKNFSLIYMETRDKIPQFCFDVISKNQDYVKRNFTSYNTLVREVPKAQSLTATKEHFISFMERQNYVKDFRERNYRGEPLIYWEEYIEFPEQQIHKIERHYGLKPWDVSFDYSENGIKQKKQVLPFQKKKVMAHADYETVFTNYEEIQSWFQ